MALYEEPDVLVKVIRYLFNEDFRGLIVSCDDAWNIINEYVNSVAPELVPRMTKYQPAPDGRHALHHQTHVRLARLDVSTDATFARRASPRGQRVEHVARQAR